MHLYQSRRSKNKSFAKGDKLNEVGFVASKLKEVSFVTSFAKENLNCVGSLLKFEVINLCILSFYCVGTPQPLSFWQKNVHNTG